MTALIDRLQQLSPERLRGLRRGVEKESLRALPGGGLALTPPPEALGSALTHPQITTDYSESQLELITGVHPSAEACLADAVGGTCEALADAQPAAVERIPAPVLLVTGDEDGVAPPQAVRALASRLNAAASVRTEVLPRCGHWTPLERAAECARLWQDFAASVVRPAHATAQPPLWSRPAAAV